MLCRETCGRHLSSEECLFGCCFHPDFCLTLMMQAFQSRRSHGKFLGKVFLIVLSIQWVVDPQNWCLVMLVPTTCTHPYLCIHAHAVVHPHPPTPLFRCGLPLIVWMPSSFIACTAIVHAHTSLDHMVLCHLCLCVCMPAVVVCKHLVSI